MNLWPLPVAKRPLANDFFMNSYPKRWMPIVTQLIKTQRHTEVQHEDEKNKAAKPLESSDLYEIFKLKRV